MVAGQSSGSWQITRAVGETGLLKPYKPGDACATTTLAMSKGNGVFAVWIQALLPVLVVSCSQLV